MRQIIIVTIVIVMSPSLKVYSVSITLGTTAKTCHRSELTITKVCHYMVHMLKKNIRNEYCFEHF
jgi:hypothetical protein